MSKVSREGEKEQRTDGHRTAHLKFGEKKFKENFSFKIYNVRMEKDDLSKLQRSRQLRTKYSEGEKW